MSGKRLLDYLLLASTTTSILKRTLQHELKQAQLYTQTSSLFKPAVSPRPQPRPETVPQKTPTEYHTKAQSSPSPSEEHVLYKPPSQHVLYKPPFRHYEPPTDPETVKLHQRQAERQIPEEPAAPPERHGEVAGENTEAGPGNELFYTPSAKASPVLSNLPRMKIPKHVAGPAEFGGVKPGGRTGQLLAGLEDGVAETEPQKAESEEVLTPTRGIRPVNYAMLSRQTKELLELDNDGNPASEELKLSRRAKKRLAKKMREMQEMQESMEEDEGQIRVHQDGDAKSSIKLKAAAGPADDQTDLHKGTDSTTVYVRTEGSEVADDVTPVKDTVITHISEPKVEAEHKDAHSAELDAVASTIIHEQVSYLHYPGQLIRN